jgi:signal peptidase I
MAWFLTSLHPPADRALTRSGAPRRARVLAVRAVAWSVIVVVGAAIAVAVLVPRLGGATPYTILTGSMRPHLPPGTLVVSRPVAARDITVGTVVTYQLTSGEPTGVTHRVVAIGRDAEGGPLFRTQGDANPEPDPAWVRPVQVRGALWYSVPWLGYPSTALSGSQHQRLSLGFAAALFLYAAAMAVGAVRERRGAGRRPAPQSAT